MLERSQELVEPPPSTVGNEPALIKMGFPSHGSSESREGKPIFIRAGSFPTVEGGGSTLDTIQDFFSNFRIKWQLN